MDTLTLLTPDEIDCWREAAAACILRSSGTADTDFAARIADTMVLELRKRIQAPQVTAVAQEPSPADLNGQLRLASEQDKRVRVIMASGYSTSGRVDWDWDDAMFPACVGGYWCGALGSDPGMRVIAVEILDT